MKLLLDMNLSPRWVELLNRAGFEAVHWSTIGSGRAADVEIMTFARREGYVLLTHDLDFGAILAATRGQKPSVVQLRSENLSIEVIGQLVIDALHEVATDLEAGALVTIDPGRTRVRVLPLIIDD
jgi:predicted nuclease of predicted toxin-antitoxin system